MIDCFVEGVKPGGWGISDSLCLDSKCLEFNTRNLDSKDPIDASQRVHYSRQLKWSSDSTLIKNYRRPEFVLDGWIPDQSTNIDTLIEKLNKQLD